MGTTMEAVQNAYRGFSRQNFTMLDNLALGFAGTKDGMQELLDKAHELSGIDYNIESYSDIVQAIHVVQTEMGITGTTAKEAATTIQGSIASMKASWEDMKVALISGDGNIDKAIENIVVTAASVYDNIEPKIEQALGGMSHFVETATPLIAEKLPPIITKIVPSLITSSTSLISALIQGVFQSVPSLMDSGISIMAQLNTALRSGSGESGSILQNVADNITSRIPTVFRFGRRIIEAIVADLLNVDYGEVAEALGMVFQTAISNLTKLVDNIDWNKLGSDIADFMNGLDWDSIVVSIGQTVGTVISNMPDLLSGILSNLDYENAATLVGLLIAKHMIPAIAASIAKSEAWAGVTTALSTQLSVSGGAAAGKAGVTIASGIIAAIGGWKIGTWIRDKIGEENIDQVVWEWCDVWKLGFDSILDAFAVFKDDFALMLDLLKYDMKEFTTDLKLGWDVMHEAWDSFTSSISLGYDVIADVFNWIENKVEAISGALGGLVDNWTSFWNGIGGKAYDFINPPYEGGLPYEDGLPSRRYSNGGALRNGSAIIAEAGPEIVSMRNGVATVTPLTRNAKNTPFGGGITVNISYDNVTITSDYDVDRMTERSVRKLSERLADLSVQQQRAVGGTGWD